MTKRLLIIFICAFLLNLAWEEAHSVLYINYKGESITRLILLRAALFDAFIIALLSTPFLLRSDLNRRSTTFALFATLTILAIGLEKWALSNGRWAYADMMPLIPYLWVGLTPTLQLGLTGLLSFRAARSL